MPPNYKAREVAVTMKEHVRFGDIYISNPRIGTPRVLFSKERIVVTGDETRMEPINNGISRPVAIDYDPDADIVLLDTVTLEPNGETVKQSLVHLALFSAAIAADRKADADQAAAEADVARREAGPAVEVPASLLPLQSPAP